MKYSVIANILDKSPVKMFQCREVIFYLYHNVYNHTDLQKTFFLAAWDIFVELYASKVTDSKKYFNNIPSFPISFLGFLIKHATIVSKHINIPFSFGLSKSGISWWNFSFHYRFSGFPENSQYETVRKKLLSLSYLQLSACVVECVFVVRVS